MVVEYGVHFFSCYFHIVLREKGVRLVVKVMLEEGREGREGGGSREKKERRRNKQKSKVGKEGGNLSIKFVGGVAVCW